MRQKKNSQTNIDRATEFVRTQRTSGLVRHYTLPNVQENISHFTGVHLNDEEAKSVINSVRAENGWESADHLEEPKPTWWQRLTGGY